MMRVDVAMAPVARASSRDQVVVLRDIPWAQYDALRRLTPRRSAADRPLQRLVGRRPARFTTSA
jgi:hypothetical protein